MLPYAVALPSLLLHLLQLPLLLLTLLLFPSASLAANALHPFCTCVLFNSSGSFHSPNYPEPIPSIPCLFYHFEAPPNHRVKLEFNVFDLPPPVVRCVNGVRLYDHTSDGTIDHSTRADFDLCGRDVPEGTVFYSRENHMLLQLIHDDVTSRGFRGAYSFLPKDAYLSDAVELSEFSYRVEKTKGTLYTPEYPYFYPSSINVTYILPQRKGHLTVLSSNELHLGKDAVLDVYDTSKGRVLLQSFTSESHNLYISSATPLLLHFIAGDNSKERARGLVIEFVYEAALSPHQLIHSEQLPPSTYAECGVVIDSKSAKTGEFSSKQLAPKGGANLPAKCSISFQGYPDERVSVKFVHFNLFVPDHKNTSNRCGELDHVTADVRVGGRLSRVDEWCGDETPPPLMSSTSLMQIEYITKSSRAIRESSRQEIGFRLQYKFHIDWDMNHMEARVDSTKPCRFIFNSSVHSSGKLWSVNYPGLYPRNLYCEYIFHGENEQTVHIHFEYFDVEGFNQCDETTQSDFVLFSNYQTHDRTNRRFCGKVAPRGPILSESNYFRMIFFTNDLFDATGFYAHYQFTRQQKAQISRVKLTSSSLQSISFLPSILLLLTIILH